MKDYNTLRQLYNEGKYSDIVTEFAQIQLLSESEDSINEDTMLLVADSFVRMGKLQESIMWYEGLLQKRPKRHIMEQLFAVYNKTDVDKEKLKALMELAEKTGESDLADSIKYYYEKKNGASDERLLELLLEIIRNDYNEELYIATAKLYYKVGNDKKADYYLKKIITKSNNEDMIDLARGLMEHKGVEVIAEVSDKNSETESKAATCTETERVESEAVTADDEMAESVEDADTKAGKESNHKLMKALERLEPQKNRVKQRIAASINYYFDNVVGLENCKREISAIYNLQNLNERMRSQGIKAEVENWNFLIGGDPGSGKSMLANMVNDMLYQYALTSSMQPRVLNAVSLLEDITLLNSQGENEEGEESQDIVLTVIDNVEKLCPDAEDTQKSGDMDNMWVYITEVIENAAKEKNAFFVFCGTPSSIEWIKSKQKKLLTFMNCLDIPKYSLDELMEMAKKFISDRELKLTEEAEPALREVVQQEFYKHDFANAYSIQNIINEAMKRKAIRHEQGLDGNGLNYFEDMDFIVAEESGETLKDLIEQLNSMIGLASVKEEVNNKVQRLIRMKENKSVNQEQEFFLHTLLLGNPGTGKTTIARLLGKIYSKLGLLSRESIFIEGSRSMLVSENLGGTAIKTRDAIESAIGGVLFIDEAYSLVTDKNDPYGKECLNTLTEFALKYRDRFMLIMAGYPEDIKTLLRYNSGLPRRFQTELFFEDYTQDEIYEIFSMKAKKKGYLLHPDVISPIKELIGRRMHSEGYENGGCAERILDRLLDAQAIRINNTDDVDELEVTMIRKEDLQSMLKNESYDAKTLEDYLEELNSMVGLASVKRDVEKRIKHIRNQQLRKEAGMKTDKFINLNTLFVGAPGTGKTTTARLLAKIYSKMDLLPSYDTFVEVKRKDLVVGYLGQTGPKVAEIIDSAMGGVLFVDEAYDLVHGETDDFGQEALNALLDIENYKGKIMVIIAGYEEDMEKLYKYNSGLKDRFPNQFKFENYTEDELYQIANNNLENADYKLAEDAEEPLRDYIRSRMSRRHFGNARNIINFLDKVKMEVSERTVEMDNVTKEDLSLILPADIQNAMGKETKELTVEDYLQKLNGLIGLSGVKAQVESLLNLLNVSKLKKERGLKGDLVNMNMIFAGPPGTGKTTVAELIGKLFGAAGLVKDGSRFKQVTGRDLVAGYVGQTKDKVKDVIEEARGGVLFIDEFYSIVAEGSSDFGTEALTALLTLIEDNKDELVVIMAGYEDKIKDVLKYNEGLLGRMNTTIYFEDYTIDELWQIFQYNVEKNGMTLDMGTEESVKAFIIEQKEAFQEAGHFFANGRAIRNFYEKTLLHQTNRLTGLLASRECTNEELCQLTLEDIEGGNVDVLREIISGTESTSEKN